MTLADRLKALRRELGLSQEAFGALGLVSAPGWIKLENGQRSPSERLINSLADWLVRQKHLAAKKRAAFVEELLSLKYLSDRSPFVRRVMRAYLTGDEAGANVPGRQLLAAFDAATAPGRARARRGRPAGTGKKGKGVAR